MRERTDGEIGREVQDHPAHLAAEGFARAVRAEAPEGAAARLPLARLAPFVVGENGVEFELECAATSTTEGHWSEVTRAYARRWRIALASKPVRFSSTRSALPRASRVLSRSDEAAPSPSGEPTVACQLRPARCYRWRDSADTSPRRRGSRGPCSSRSETRTRWAGAPGERSPRAARPAARRGARGPGRPPRECRARRRGERTRGAPARPPKG